MLKENRKTLNDLEVKYPEYAAKLNGKSSPISGYPHMRGDRILNTRQNIQHMLDNHQITVRYNLMKRQREIIIPDMPMLPDEKENANYEHIHSLASFEQVPVSTLDERLYGIAWSNSYHPIQDAIIAKPWDGIERLDEFVKSIQSYNQSLAQIILKTWMCSAIASAFSKEGFAAQGVLVLQGEQGIGKTRFTKHLDFGNFNAVKEGACLDPKCKDDIINASRFWIVEIGELDATFRKSDVARLKSYLTNQIDYVRFPYGRHDSYLYRRTVFVATVNESDFLIDVSGNRRWWTIPVISINLDHGLDMQQIWAEVYHLWINEKLSPYLSEEEQEQVNKNNRQHEKLEPMEEKLRLKYDWSAPLFYETNCFDILNKLGYDKIELKDTRLLSNLYKKITGIKKLSKTGGTIKYTMPRERP